MDDCLTNYIKAGRRFKGFTVFETPASCLICVCKAALISWSLFHRFRDCLSGITRLYVARLAIAFLTVFNSSWRTVVEITSRSLELRERLFVQVKPYTMLLNLSDPD